LLIGLLMAVVGGLLVSLQTIFNSNVNVKTNSWVTTTLVLGLGALASLICGLIFEGVQFFSIGNLKAWHWFCGLLGIGVVTFMVKGIRLLGPTYAISIALASQLGSALLIDSFGWFGLQKIPFTSQQLIGVLVIVGGIIVFKFSGFVKSDIKEGSSALSK
jgi:bacterial/archaeal transporter family-2 protein